MVGKGLGNAERALPCCAESAGDRIDAEKDLRQEFFAGLDFRRTPLRKEGDLLDMK